MLYLNEYFAHKIMILVYKIMVLCRKQCCIYIYIYIIINSYTTLFNGLRPMPPTPAYGHRRAGKGVGEPLGIMKA